MNNGLEAVEKLGSMPPDDRYDCILMDLEMPVMDGYTATRLLREDEAGGGRVNAIVALSAFTAEQADNEAGNARQAQVHDKMGVLTM